MPEELPVYSIVAMATVTAALIAATIAFVNLTLTKELKTSEFRQTWINSLREDLSIFFACTRAFARATEEQYIFDESKSEVNSFRISSDKISDVRYQVAEVYSRITLKLNYKELEHEELLRLMKVAIDKQNEAIENKFDSTETMKAIETATKYARPLIKKEWDRVKEGEPAFKNTRNAAFVGIVVLCLAVIFFIAYGVFK
ncbi:MAG: hypothetical protein V7765_12285 [Oleispira sp.]|jgi:hypothetical protein